MICNFDQLLSHAQSLGTRIVAIAGAQDEAALSALLEARKMGLAEGKLFGNRSAIIRILESLEVEPEAFEIRDFPDEVGATQAAVECVRRGEADILLKGKTQTAVLLKAVLDPEHGLRTPRLLSDAFVFEDPHRSENKLVMITDGGVNIAPDLQQKIQIVQNAVDLAHLLGNSNPKVALLSAVETVSPSIPSTVDAAIIAKMNQRGQIKGCTIDGPLALDNAICKEAAQIKGIDSPVAGEAEILVCPNIESANLLAKSTTFWAGFRLGHLIMGASAPILIPSRVDTPDAKLLSVAFGVIVSHRKM